MPARAVACGLAKLAEGVGESEQGARAVRPQFDAQAVAPPPTSITLLAAVTPAASSIRSDISGVA